MHTGTLRKSLMAAALGAALVSASGSQASDSVFAGYDLFITQPGTDYDFQGFAGLGVVPFQGNPLGTFDFGSGLVSVGMVDTIVERLSAATVGVPTIPIEIVALSLQSVDPIDIGNGPEFILVTLNSSVSGNMTINGLATEGLEHGTFSSVMNFNFDVAGTTTGFLGTIGTTLTGSGGEWGHYGNPLAGVPVIPQVNDTLNGVNKDNDFQLAGISTVSGGGGGGGGGPYTGIGETHPGDGIHVAGSNMIPAVSEWGMFIMVLLGTALVTVAIQRQSMVLLGAGAGGGQLAGRPQLFVPNRYAKTLLAVLALVVVGTLAIALSGIEVATQDVVGSLISASIAAYILHLWIAPTGPGSEDQ